MRRDILEIDSTMTGADWKADPLDLADIEAIRLLLTGSSVVDWQRLAFQDPADVDGFLSLYGIDLSVREHRDRARFLFNEAVSYLEEHLKLHFPRELRSPKDIRQVLLWASQSTGFRRTQILSCVILKLMHVLQHLASADLRHRVPISEVALLELAHQRILRSARSMQDEGMPVVSFTGNRKSRSSVITKLIAKRDNLAAQLFDKLRYRCIVQDRRHLPSIIAWMARNMFPFNYVLPGQSYNNLLDMDALIATLPVEAQQALQQFEADPTAEGHTKNEFSGASYRMINFIIDYPIPLPPEQHPFDIELGNVVFVQVEIQVLDETTARTNEVGENAHHLYKQRQEQVVAQRLKRGGFRR